MPMESQAQSPMLLDQVRNVMRVHHYSIHTERSYLDWIKRYIKFHHMRSREDLAGAEAKIEAFLTSLAVHANVAASTQNQERVTPRIVTLFRPGGHFCFPFVHKGRRSRSLAAHHAPFQNRLCAPSP